MGTEDKKRIEYIDVIKGITIFLMVWGHAIQVGGTDRDIFEDNLFTFIYSFHMPLFMMLSGYIFSKTINKRSFSENIKNKTMHLGVSAIFWGMTFYIVKIVIENFFLQNVYSFSINELCAEIWNVWFLWAVLFCSVAVLVAEKLRYRKLYTLTLIIAFPILYLLPNGEFNVFLFPFFLIGYMWEKKENRWKKQSYFLLMLFPLLLSYYCKEHYIYVSGIARQIRINLFRWITGLAGSVAVIVITKGIIMETSGTNIFNKIFCELGKYTLEIYVMQRILVEYLGAKVMWKIVNEIGPMILQNEFVYNYIFTLLFTAIYLVVLYFIAFYYRKVINRIKTKLYVKK